MGERLKCALRQPHMLLKAPDDSVCSVGELGSYQTRCIMLFDLNVTQMGENLTPNDANTQHIP